MPEAHSREKPARRRLGRGRGRPERRYCFAFAGDTHGRALEPGRLALSKKHCIAGVASYVTADFNAMADIENKYAENVVGSFYVDDQCIDCDLCRETAPANFTRNDDGGHSFVFKQPQTDDERALCQEAMEGCPVEAIGADGT